MSIVVQLLFWCEPVCEQLFIRCNGVQTIQPDRRRHSFLPITIAISASVKAAKIILLSTVFEMNSKVETVRKQSNVMTM